MTTTALDGPRPYDVVVAGGGPTGLAFAIAARLQGLSVVLLERQGLPADKACGEGLMPSGLRVLEKLGVLPHLDADGFAPLRGIRYVLEDGTAAEAELPARGGLGIRRLALEAALVARARALGIPLLERRAARSHHRTPAGLVVDTDAGALEGRLFVAADGLASPTREREGIGDTRPARRRFGLRRHFALAPWSSLVEVHFSAPREQLEAYVTPVGPRRVGVALLWTDGALAPPITFEALLSRFPRLEARVRDASPDSAPRGAGPLVHRAHRVVGPRLALLGDAAGSVDPITGEGLALGLGCAQALAALAPEALRQGASVASLGGYQRFFAREYRRCALLSRSVLAVAERPALRHLLVSLLARQPWALRAVLATALTPRRD
jgi:2-polyprenyl-6-methoxyphenol hydroxylase-like FAD-dependent oxidoreductase